jgi:3-methyladenine DNA glycosylase AlkD
MPRAISNPRSAPRARNRPASPASRTALQRELRNAADPKRAASVAKFFKTGKGEYAEGDRFIGIPVPVLRKIARQYVSLGIADLKQLLASPIHEYRSAALEILVAQYARADELQRDRIVTFYLRHTRRMNSWDLVDAAAPYILGRHLKTRSRKVLHEFAVSPNLWERRIAIVATLALVRGGDVDSQSCRLGAARERQSFQRGACRFPPAALRAYPTHHSAIRHRALHTPAAQEVSGRRVYQKLKTAVVPAFTHREQDRLRSIHVNSDEC